MSKMKPAIFLALMILIPALLLGLFYDILEIVRLFIGVVLVGTCGSGLLSLVVAGLKRKWPRE